MAILWGASFIDLGFPIQNYDIYESPDFIHLLVCQITHFTVSEILISKAEYVMYEIKDIMAALLIKQKNKHALSILWILQRVLFIMF